MKFLQYTLLVICMATNVIAQEYLLYYHPKDKAIYSKDISTKQEVLLYQANSHVSTPYLVNKDTLVFNEVASDGCVGYSLKEKKYLFKLGWHYGLYIGCYILESNFHFTNFHRTHNHDFNVYDMNYNVEYTVSYEDTNFVKDENVLEKDMLWKMYNVEEKVILLFKASVKEEDKYVLWLLNLEEKYISKIKEFNDIVGLPMSYDYHFTKNKKYYFVRTYDKSQDCTLIYLLNLKTNRIDKIIKNYTPITWYSNHELVVSKDQEHVFLYNVETDQVTKLFSDYRIGWCRCLGNEKLFFFYDSPILPGWLNPGGFLMYDFTTREKSLFKRLGYRIYDYGGENWRPYRVSEDGEIINYH